MRCSGNAARPGRADYELIAEIEAFFRANGVDHNFQIIGVGGPEVRGMAPPSGRKLKRGDMVTTELTPCVDGYYAQICRTLVVGEANADQKAAHALWRESMEAGIAVVRDGVTAADIARAENDVFRAHGMGEYTTSEYTRVRGHGLGLFVDTKPHILEDVTTRIDAGMTLIVHPNTYHPVVGYMVLGDSVVVTEDGCEVRHGNAARTVQRAGLRSKRDAPRIDGLGCRRNCRQARSTSVSARLQAAMRRDGFDALVLYSNLVRPSAVCWLTGFTPYWIESLLLVGREGAPLLATALSKRVSDWIRATSQLGEIINTPKPGTAIGQRLAAAGCKRVGVAGIRCPAGRSLRRHHRGCAGERTDRRDGVVRGRAPSS